MGGSLSRWFEEVDCSGCGSGTVNGTGNGSGMGS